MPTMQKILFAVDFSASCDAMVPFVQRAAAILAAKVTVLHVFERATSGVELLGLPAPMLTRIAKNPPARRLPHFGVSGA